MNTMKHRKIEKNVIKFMDKACKSYGKIQQERFSQEIFSDLLERGISSPIEDIFYIALRLQCHEFQIEFEQTPDYDSNTNTVTYGDGIYINHQAAIGKYKVDFLISYQSYGSSNQIIIELDGHDFHDKDKHQRAYEKARDRFLLKSGYKTFHYTGSELVNKPHHVVFEVLTELGVQFFGDTLEEHDPNNLLGWNDAK